MERMEGKGVSRMRVWIGRGACGQFSEEEEEKERCVARALIATPAPIDWPQRMNLVSLWWETL